MCSELGCVNLIKIDKTNFMPTLWGHGLCELGSASMNNVFFWREVTWAGEFYTYCTIPSVIHQM